MLRIEFEKPRRSTCECCGGTSTTLTRFVYRDEVAFAVYYAAFSDNHADRAVSVVVSLGEWGEGSAPEARRAFSMRIWSGDTNYEVMVTDVAECPWRDAKVIGPILSREQALSHPWIKNAFHVTDHIVVQDQLVKEYLDARTA
jgi:hypothetical protein